MDRIHPAILANLQGSLIGRLKLNLYRKMTGREGIAPSAKERQRFVKPLVGKDQIVALELFHYVLQDARYGVLQFKDLEKTVDMPQLLAKLDSAPLKQPMFYEVQGYTEAPLGILIHCHQLRDLEGYFYALCFLSERDFPDRIAYFEVRSSQKHPEPAFVYHNEQGISTTAGQSDSIIRDDPNLWLCLQALDFLANNHIDSFVPVTTAVKNQRKFNLKGPGRGPDDPRFMTLIKKAYLRQLACHSGWVTIGQVVPFSYEACLEIPLPELEHLKRDLDKIRQLGIVVYYRDGVLVSSDDYLIYLACRAFGDKEIKVILLGNEGLELLGKHISGDALLIPDLYVRPARNIDQLSPAYRELLLNDHVGKLAACMNLESLLQSKCVVLSEDSLLQYLQVLLSANGFQTSETTLMSYENCTKLDLLPLTLETLRRINPALEFIIHRDRDYLSDEAEAAIVAKIRALGGQPLITRGTDMESYFLDQQHISHLYPQLSQDTISNILQQAFARTRALSTEKMLKALYNNRYTEHLGELPGLEAQYDANPERYANGKETLRAVKDLLRPLLFSNAELLAESPFLRTGLLTQISARLWPF